MRTNFRFIAFAIARPSEVLPTPGGPVKQRMGPFMEGFSFRTLRYSSILSFTFASPKCPLSSTVFAFTILITSLLELLQGISTNQSRYVLIREASDESACI